MLTKQDIQILRTLIQEETRSLKDDITAIKSEVFSHGKQLNAHNTKLNRVIKDVSWISKSFDKEIVENRQRLEQIEKRLRAGFPPTRE